MNKLVLAVLLVILCSPACAGTLGIVSPASCINSEDIELADLILRSHDFTLKMGAYVYEADGYFAGTDQQRADDLNAMFRDDSVDVIVCTRGGYGAARILGLLDYGMIAEHPKPIIGFSDITALLNVLIERCGTPAVHAPVLTTLNRSEYSLEHFLAGLKGETVSGEIPMPEGKILQTVIPGHAEGSIMGGNLTLIASLVGTPYELKAEGALLLLEEVGEKPYRIDRMLNQLWQSGLFKRVNGILLGDFVGCDIDIDDPDGRIFTVDDVLEYYAQLSGKPVIRGVPAGHGKDNMFLPLGVHAVMNGNTDGTASLILGR